MNVPSFGMKFFRQDFFFGKFLDLSSSGEMKCFKLVFKDNNDINYGNSTGQCICDDEFWSKLTARFQGFCYLHWLLQQSHSRCPPFQQTMDKIMMLESQRTTSLFTVTEDMRQGFKDMVGMVRYGNWIGYI